MNKAMWNFEIYIPRDGVRLKDKIPQDWALYFVKNFDSLWLLLYILLTWCSSTPVLEEIMNSHFPTILISLLSSIHKRKQFGLLYHPSIRWQEVTNKAQSHQRGWAEHVSTPGLINLAHAGKLQCYRKTATHISERQDSAVLNEI